MVCTVCGTMCAVDTAHQPPAGAGTIRRSSKRNVYEKCLTVTKKRHLQTCYCLFVRLVFNPENKISAKVHDFLGNPVFGE